MAIIPLSLSTIDIYTIRTYIFILCSQKLISSIEFSLSRKQVEGPVERWRFLDVRRNLERSLFRLARYPLVHALYYRVYRLSTPRNLLPLRFTTWHAEGGRFRVHNAANSGANVN